MFVTVHPRVGTEFAGYRIEALVAREGMAECYRAIEVGLGRKVALKLLAPELAGDERFRDRFLRESQIAASLDHPHVIPIYDAGETDGLLYIAMRYVAGTDLRKILDEEGRLEPNRALRVLGSVADALDAAHERGLVHRDVKPENVLIALDPHVSPPEHVYLADFGLTKSIGETGLRQPGQCVGTIGYVPPEKVAATPVDARADVYSLGYVLFECLTGQPPFRRDPLIATLWGHVNEPPPSASERNPELPAAIDPVIAKAMAKEPEERYASCRELIADARRVFGEAEASRAPSPSQEPVSDGGILDFRLLGPLEVGSRGRTLDLGGPKPRALLAILLLRAGEVVPSDRLIEELWAERPPRSAQHLLHVYVSRVRKALESGAASGSDGILLTRSPGYLLDLDPGELDVRRFERLLGEGRRVLAAGDPVHAAKTLRKALDLWRGPALADFTYEPFAQAEIARLDELRLLAREERVEADLALGKHLELVGELEALVAESPFRERPRGQLMLALYRCGRQADALKAYQEARRVLVDELGLEPSPALQHLQQAILRHDAALELDRGLAQPSPRKRVEAPGRAMRKLVTILVAGLADSSGLDGLDPEARRSVVARALEPVTAALTRHGAAVEQLVGEAVMGVFGLPEAHEDDALRGARAASEARAAVEAVNVELERDWGVRVAPCIGVESGEVVVTGESPDPGSIAGDAMALAARLSQSAPPGVVLLGESTYGLVRHGVLAEADPAPLTRASGLAGRRRLVAVLPEAPTLERRADSPLVGRELELAQLRQAFERAARYRTLELVTILGEPGVGKSRLAEELASSLGDEATVLVGRCLSYGEGISFWPLREIVQREAGAETRRALLELLADDEEGEAIADQIAAVSGTADAAGAREEAFWAFRRLFEAAARRRPLLVVFEDVHWGEPTFLDFIEYLLDWEGAAPILVLCLARPELLEERQSWTAGRRNAAATILLHPLSADESEALLDHLAGGVPLPAEARARIVQAAEGNPLFLEQMLAMLAEGKRSRDEIAFPSTIRAVLAARLDRLGPAERAVLERASVAGREFWPDGVGALLPLDVRPSLHRHLQTLIRKEYVRVDRSALPGQEAFRFRHSLIQEAAYRSIPKEPRAELHERLAEWLEGELGDRIGEYEEIVGYHFEQAFRYREELRAMDGHARGLAARAADRLASAGKRARAREDLPSAANLLGRAVSLKGEGDARRLELLLVLVEALRETGEPERGLALATEAIEGAAAAGDRSLETRGRLERAYVRLMIDREGAVQDADEESKRAVAVFEELRDDLGLARAWLLIALTLRLRGRQSERREALERVLEHARRAGDRRTETAVHNMLGGVYVYGPSPIGVCLDYVDEVIEWARAHGERSVLVNALAHGLGRIWAMLGRFEDAREYVAQAKSIAEDLGFPWTRAGVASAAGFVEMLAGDPATAERELRAGLEVLERSRLTGSFFGQAQRDELAQAVYAQGRYEEAKALSDESEKQAASDDAQAQVGWRAVRAKVLAREGRFDEAEALAREAVAIVEQTEFLIVHANALMDLGEVLQLAGRPDEARPVVEDALRLHEQKSNRVAAARARAVLAELDVSLATPVREGSRLTRR